MAFNAWHDISPGDDVPNIVTAIIEIPSGSKVKYELDKETGLIAVDRILHSPFRYPANYGFVPKTYCDDKDPLDVLVLCSEDLLPGVKVDARVIGVMKMLDDGEGDDKVIAVAEGDPRYKDVKDLSDLPEIVRGEMKMFFEDYKKLRGKSCEITAVLGVEDGRKVVEDSIKLYDENF
jgi:inorganic pyrophosphatase